MNSKTFVKKQIPVAWAVMAIAFALVLVLVSAIGLLIWNSYSDVLERTRVRVETSSQVVSTHVEWLIAASLRVLHDADKLAGSDPAAISSADASAFQWLLQFFRLPHYQLYWRYRQRLYLYRQIMSSLLLNLQPLSKILLLY